MLVLRGAIAGTLALTVTQMAVGGLLAALSGSLPHQPSNTMPWLVLSDLLLATSLAWLARQSRLHGLALAATLWTAAMLVAPVSSLIEAVFFNVLTRSEAIAVIPNVVLPLAAGVLAVVYAAGTWRAPGRAGAAPDSPRWPPVLVRGATASVCYVVCYIAAGILVLPFVRDFYSSRTLPPAGAILGMQLLVRGPMFVVAITLLLRQVPASRARHAAVGVVLMSVVGGLVSLITPNAFMPDAVRYAHMVEVVTSNALFGAVTGWLMSPGRAILAAPRRPLEASAEGIAHERIR